ncbi:class II fructose-bisphosphate aldolase [Nanoarchaeota archaeon]
MTKPIPGSYIFNALHDKNCIIMACNTRITLVTKGLMRAAKEMDSAILIELAISESNLEGGYTGLTPKDLAERSMAAAEEVGQDVWALHADHIGIKKGTPEDLENIKKIVAAQIEAGFTSFAIDASHLYNHDGKDDRECLDPNIQATIELGKFIDEKYKEKHGNTDYSLEAEVGEVGKKDSSGMVITTPNEAKTFISALNEAGVNPHILATSNGSTHGNIFDKDGNPIEQISIDIPRTKEIAQALKDMGSQVRIAQHGITGTPRNLIKEKFPHGDIIKGNVGTFWQNVFYDVLKEKEPELYDEIYKWVMDTYKPKMPDKRDVEIFGKNSKHATKVFFDKIYGLSDETKKAIEDKAYEEAKIFMDAFNSKGTASIVRKYMEEKGLGVKN